MQVLTQNTIFPLMCKHLDSNSTHGYRLSITCSLFRQLIFDLRKKNRCQGCKTKGFFCWTRECSSKYHDNYDKFVCISTGVMIKQHTLRQGEECICTEFSCTRHARQCRLRDCDLPTDHYYLCSFHRDNGRCSLCGCRNERDWDVCVACNDNLLCRGCHIASQGRCEHCVPQCPKIGCTERISHTAAACWICNVKTCAKHTNGMHWHDYCWRHYERCNHQVTSTYTDEDVHICKQRASNACVRCEKITCAGHAGCGSHCVECCTCRG